MGAPAAPRALDRVVRVDEERAAVRVGTREGAERLELVRERLDERMRHRARDRDAVELAREDVARGVEAGEVARAGGGEPGAPAVLAAQAELDEEAALRRVDRAGRLAREERVQVDDVHERGLDELRLEHRTGHLEDRLPRGGPAAPVGP